MTQTLIGSSALSILSFHFAGAPWWRLRGVGLTLHCIRSLCSACAALFAGCTEGDSGLVAATNSECLARSRSSPSIRHRRKPTDRHLSRPSGPHLSCLITERPVPKSRRVPAHLPSFHVSPSPHCCFLIVFFVALPSPLLIFRCAVNVYLTHQIQVNLFQFNALILRIVPESLSQLYTSVLTF